MIIKLTLVGLVLVLILVIATSYYVNKEGFDDISNLSKELGNAINTVSSNSTPRVVVTTEVDDIFLNINANTTDGSTIYGAKILYNSSTPVLSPGQTTDSTLALDLVIPPTTFTVYNKPLSAFQNGYKYYIVSNNVSKYVEGTTPLLGSFIFNNNSPAPTPSPTPAPAPGPSPAPGPIPTPTPSPGPAPFIPPTPTPTPSPGPAPFIPPTPTPTPGPAPTPTPFIPPIPSVPSSIPSSIPTIPKRTDVIPEVSISGSGYDAMNLQQRAELLKDIQKLVRNEILANRSTTPIISGETRKDNKSDSTAQGKEYENSCYKDTEYRCPKNPDGTCPPVPDMSQYIKKDEIPCWGCALDY
jgi:hypothetical protein